MAINFADNILKCISFPNADIAKTFGHLLDRRTSKHVENSDFTGPPKVLLDAEDLIFFNIISLVQNPIW